MKEKIHEILNPVLNKNDGDNNFNIIDDSASHAGHAGNPNGGGNTHFIIEIKRSALPELSTLERHKKINALLAPLFADIHSISIKFV